MEIKKDRWIEEQIDRWKDKQMNGKQTKDFKCW